MEASSLELLTQAPTKESIDLFYINQYISEREYLAAMKFRWLYAQVNGNVQIKPYNFSRVQGKNTTKDEAWLEQQAADYSFIKRNLVAEKHYRIIFDIMYIKPICCYKSAKPLCKIFI